MKISDGKSSLAVVCLLSTCCQECDPVPRLGGMLLKGMAFELDE